MDPALAKRVASGAGLAVVALIAVWLGGWPFVGLVLAAVLVMAHEWTRLATDADGITRTLLQLLGGLLPGLAVVATARGDAIDGLLFLAVAVPIAAACGGLAYPRVSGRASLGVLYLGLPALLLVWLRREPHGAALVLWLLLVVWTTDIAAYFVGRAIGGAKLAPSISPGKTWAGLIGGMLGAALVGGMASSWTGGPVSLGVVVAPALATVAQAGDLFESFLKRRAGVKDSGSLIPGHGGALDRLDGLLFATPVYALLVGFGARVVG